MNAVVSALAPLQGFVSALVTYLAATLVLGTALAALAALLVRCWKPLDAAARHAVWWVALVAIVLGPLATTFATERALRGPSDAEIRAAMQRFDAARGPVKIEIRAPRPALAVPPLLADGVAALWLLLVLGGLARFAAGVFVLGKLKRDALPVSPQRRAELPLWSARAGGRPVRLCVSDRVDVPLAVGLFDGMIVLPQHVLETFAPSDVDRFVLHELAHLERRDDWTSAVARLVQVLLFFHPAVHLIARRLDLEREIACDDRVVAATADVRSYAIGLTKMAEATVWPHAALAAPAIFATREHLSLRVEELLARRRITARRAATVPAALVLVASLSVVAVAMPLAPRASVGVSSAPRVRGRILQLRDTKFVRFNHNGQKTPVNEQLTRVIIVHGAGAPPPDELLTNIQSHLPTR